MAEVPRVAKLGHAWHLSHDLTLRPRALLAVVRQEPHVVTSATRGRAAVTASERYQSHGLKTPKKEKAQPRVVVTPRRGQAQPRVAFLGHAWHYDLVL